MKPNIETEVAKELNKRKTDNAQPVSIKKGANEFRYCSGCEEEMPVQFRTSGSVKTCSCLICGQEVK